MSALTGTLVSIAAEVGAPLVRKALSKHIGQGSARLAEDVLGALADRMGVGVDGVEDFARTNPELARAAVRDVELAAPEFYELAVTEAETNRAVMLAETAKGGWQSIWRPAAMYVLAFLWLWNIVLLHVLNAVFKIALPPTPHDTLLTLTGMYMTLYMGGHTAKEMVKTWKGRR